MPFLEAPVEVCSSKTDTTSDFVTVNIPQNIMPYEAVAAIVEFDASLSGGSNQLETAHLYVRGSETGHVYTGTKLGRVQDGARKSGTFFVPVVDGPVVDNQKNKAFDYMVGGLGFDEGLSLSVIGYVGACLETDEASSSDTPQDGGTVEGGEGV